MTTRRRPGKRARSALTTAGIGLLIVMSLFANTQILPQVLSKASYVLGGCPGAGWDRQARLALAEVTEQPLDSTHVAPECYGSQVVGVVLPKTAGLCDQIRSSAERHGWDIRSLPRSLQGLVDDEGPLCDFAAYRRIGGIWSDLWIFEGLVGDSIEVNVSNSRPPSMPDRLRSLLPGWWPETGAR